MELNKNYMNERNILINENSTRTVASTGMPKTGIGQIAHFFSKTFDTVSDFFHKWAKP